MNYFAGLFIIALSIYCTISWLIPQLLAWLFKRKYKVDLKIGRIVIHKLILKDVTIVKKGYKIHIEQISFHSSLTNSEVTKLLSIVIRDVRVNKDVFEKKQSKSNSGLLKPLLMKQNSFVTNVLPTITSDPISKEINDINTELNNMTKDVLDFRDMELPTSIVLFTQFLAVKIYNLSVMILRAEEGEGINAGWLCHATAASVRLDGSGTASYLLLSGSIAEARAKLLRSTPNPNRLQTCLVEVSFGVNLEISMLVDSPLNVEKVACSISNPTATLNEGIYRFMQEKKYTIKKYNVPIDVPQPNCQDSLLTRITPIIPKNFTFKIDGTVLTGVRENSRTDFCASLHTLQINARFSANSLNNSDDMDNPIESPSPVRLPQVYLAFQMDQLKINSNKEKLLFLDKLKLDAKLVNEVLNLYLILKMLTLSYNHDDIYEWFSKYFLPKDLDLLSSSNIIFKEKKSNTVPSWISKFCDICVIQGCAEFWNVSLGGRRGSHSTTLACKGLKVKLDQLSDLRCTPYKSNFASLIVGMRHWSTELLIDSAWLQVGSSETPTKKHHTWGTGFFVGVALIKWGSHGLSGTKIEAMLDCLRAEGSPMIAKTIINLIECINDYSSNTELRRERQIVKSDSKLIININLTNVNLFTLTQDNIALMARIDTISIERNGAKSGFVISGFKITDIVASNNHYICQRTEEINNAFCFVKLARIDTEVRLYTIELLEIVNIYWSANLHLRCLATIKELKEFRSSLREILNIQNEPDKTEKPSSSWSLTFKGDVGVHIKLWENHKLLFNFDDITFARDVGGFNMSWNSCHIAVDDAEIFTIEGVTLERIQSNDKILEERQNAEDFVLNWNKTWGVTILSFRVIFPHKHNFAEAIQDEFVSLTKWIKMVHNYKKKQFTADSPLPSDLCIQIEEFILEMTDDPFEVRLRDNYELLEDEYKESLKRKNMLDAKVAELCKPHLFLPAGKVEELYAGLNRCNAQIYVQRSRQLSRGTSSRTLSTCRLMKLHILALADPTIHGTVNCVKNLRQIDPDSPWPEEGLEFTTLWCRWISASCSEWRLQLRDFPQPLLCAVSINLWGRLMGAEQSPPPRARRVTKVDQGAPWGSMEIERSMTSLKFYHDLNCEMDQYRYAFGPCWEPIIAQSNLSWEQVVRGSRDPSAPMVWWDKMRLMMHGRLTLCVHRMALLLHASLDPYNTTEEMELAWTDLVLDWTNAKIVFKGDLNVYVRTASKYDDCCLLHLPNLRLVSKIKWLCLADPNDHHCVIQCAPDKIPEYSINQEHDSFRAFRSQGLDIHLSFETRPNANENDCPRVLLYGSTLRWFESLKQILSGATRPTRRGAVFNNVRPRKPQLSRHFRNARLSLALHCFQTTYWMSFAKQRGVDVCGQRVTCGAQHTLLLTPTRDGLRRRPRATWPPLYINCELNNAEVWFSLFEDLHKEITDLPKLVRYYCLSVGKVSYGRELSGGLPPANTLTTGESPPTHRLVVHDMKAAWTKTNRDIAFALFDTYMKNKQLKKNLSTEALKIFHAEDAESNVQSGRGPQPVTPATPPTASIHTSGGQTQALLAQLVAEAEHKSVVFSDDLSEGTTQPPPHAAACALDDTSHCNWLIALVNAQVVLRGCETKGYVVLCAARAEVRQRLKRSCSTWAGSLQSMQYYATVSARENLHLHENIMWVSVGEIEEKGPPVYSALPDVPSLVGSGHSAGGVLGSTVGPCDDQSHAPQLQRIVSRCTCEFYYVGYEESVVSTEPNGGSAWGEPDTPCDSFTLMHHDLDVCTNSLQYAMLLDVVNNLVLYVEPQRKRALERLARMRFQIQLHRVSDPRRPIQLLQNQVRGLVAKLRYLERETYLIQKAQSEGNAGPNHDQNLQDLQRQVMECKEQLARDGEELHTMVACYQESRYRAPAAQAHSAAPVRANEIYFKHAQWRLTDADGQLGIADLVLSNFQYTKNTKSDDSVEHLLELGYVRMTNLLPNEAYTEVLVPTEGRSHMPVARQRVLRVFCRERPPVGGISVKEHFEINVVPITIALTKKFFNKMLKFCFPERDPDKIEEGSIDYDDTASTTGSLKNEKGSSKKVKSKKLGKDTNFYVKIEQKDDVEKMKERAEKNKLFIYIKIPEVPVRVSYKGNKEKNLEDLRDISIVIPTLEYHNVTWTWLDLLLAMKSDSKKVIISQALRQKLQLHRNKGVGGGSTSPPEEDKARMLLGDRRTGEAKPQKKTSTSTFRFQK